MQSSEKDEVVEIYVQKSVFEFSKSMQLSLFERMQRNDAGRKRILSLSENVSSFVHYQQLSLFVSKICRNIVKYMCRTKVEILCTKMPKEVWLSTVEYSHNSFRYEL